LLQQEHLQILGYFLFLEKTSKRTSIVVQKIQRKTPVLLLRNKAIYLYIYSQNQKSTVKKEASGWWLAFYINIPLIQHPYTSLYV